MKIRFFISIMLYLITCNIDVKNVTDSKKEYVSIHNADDNNISEEKVLKN